jgi:gliotoxin/aspirochlorine biosynthesis thioredoxin reductase
MAQVPSITNGLIRSALQLAKNVVVYTNDNEEVVVKLRELTNALGDRVTFDNRPIERLIKEPTKSQVTIELNGGDRVTQGFLVHGPRNEMNLGFARNLTLEKAPPFGGELKVSQPFNETTEPGCFAGGDCSSMGKILVASVAFGTFAATGAIRQLQGL